MKVLKILHEKWQKLCLIEAILGYLVLPHSQRLKAVQVNFICYFAEGSHSSSGISLFHKGVSVKAVVGKFQCYWGTLPRQSKVKYICDPVSSKMPLTNTAAIAAYEKTAWHFYL